MIGRRIMQWLRAYRQQAEPRPADNRPPATTIPDAERQRIIERDNELQRELARAQTQSLRVQEELRRGIDVG